MWRTGVTRERNPLPSRRKYPGILRLPSTGSSVRQELYRSKAERHAHDTLQTFGTLRPSCLQRFLIMFQGLFLAHLNLGRSSRCVTRWFNVFCAPIGPDTSTRLNSPVGTAAEEIRCVHADNSHPDASNPDLIRIKVGRSVDVRSRLRQHRKRCPTSKPKLLGQFPSTAPPQTPRVRFYDRLERLIHIELAELSANSYPPARSAVNVPCVDCQYTHTVACLAVLNALAGHTRHTEIFVFKRLRGKYRGKEWSLIIRPVIQKWARFVNLL